MDVESTHYTDEEDQDEDDVEDEEAGEDEEEDVDDDEDGHEDQDLDEDEYSEPPGETNEKLSLRFGDTQISNSKGKRKKLSMVRFLVRVRADAVNIIDCRALNKRQRTESGDFLPVTSKIYPAKFMGIPQSENNGEYEDENSDSEENLPLMPSKRRRMEGYDVDDPFLDDEEVIDVEDNDLMKGDTKFFVHAAGTPLTDEGSDLVAPVRRKPSKARTNNRSLGEGLPTNALRALEKLEAKYKEEVDVSNGHHPRRIPLALDSVLAEVEKVRRAIADSESKSKRLRLSALFERIDEILPWGLPALRNRMRATYESQHVAGSLQQELEEVISRLESKIQDQAIKQQLKGESAPGSKFRVNWKDLADDLLKAANLNESFIKASNKSARKKEQIDEDDALMKLLDRIRAFFPNDAVSMHKMRSQYRRYVRKIRAGETVYEDKSPTKSQNGTNGTKSSQKSGSKATKSSKPKSSKNKSSKQPWDSMELSQSLSRSLMPLPKDMFSKKYYPGV